VPLTRWAAVGVATALGLSACSADSPPDVSSPAPADAPAGASEGAPAGGPSTTSPPQAAPVDDGRPEVESFPVPAGSRPHDVAPAPDGTIWYTAQLARALGQGSAPHGVIVGPDGAPWITDGGLNAIVRVDPASEEVRRFPMPAGTPSTNLNTAVFGRDGTLWFTGQSGYYGRLDPVSGLVEVFNAPRGRGPYGITVTPDGSVYYASLAGNHIARIDPATNTATPIDPPTAGQGARRVWSDSQGRVWVSEWTSGQVSVYDPRTGDWREWKLPGARPQAYAVYVDERDAVWLTDFGGNAIVRFDPATEQFRSYPMERPSANVRQLLGHPGEVWGAESAHDRLVVVRVR
jgi:virginiamycin B lyase